MKGWRPNGRRNAMKKNDEIGSSGEGNDKKFIRGGVGDGERDGVWTVACGDIAFDGQRPERDFNSFLSVFDGGGAGRRLFDADAVVDAIKSGAMAGFGDFGVFALRGMRAVPFSFVWAHRLRGGDDAALSLPGVCGSADGGPVWGAVSAATVGGHGAVDRGRGAARPGGRVGTAERGGADRGDRLGGALRGLCRGGEPGIAFGAEGDAAVFLGFFGLRGADRQLRGWIGKAHGASRRLVAWLCGGGRAGADGGVESVPCGGAQADWLDGDGDARLSGGADRGGGGRGGLWRGDGDARRGGRGAGARGGAVGDLRGGARAVGRGGRGVSGG